MKFIRLHDTVTQVLTDRLIDEVRRISGQDIELQIDSPGGNVRHGWQLFQAIEGAKAEGSRVTAKITGQASSMGSVLAMSADRIEIEDGAVLMVHDVSVNMGGNPAELRELADIADEVSDELAGVYARRSGKPATEVRDMMRKTTFLTASEAVELGFADATFSSPKAIPDTWLDRLAAHADVRNLTIPDFLGMPQSARLKLPGWTLDRIYRSAQPGAERVKIRGIIRAIETTSKANEK